jgi:hypothetical protein
MSLEEIAELPRIPKLRPEGVVFRRTDSVYSEVYNPNLNKMEGKWIFVPKDVTLQQQILVKDPTNPRDMGRTVTIQVDDLSRPIMKEGVTVGYTPIMYPLYENRHGSVNTFMVKDPQVYYYLMLSEMNAYNTVENGRRRANSQVGVCFELYNPAKDIEAKRKDDRLRNKAIGKIENLDEIGCVVLLRRYGKSDQYPMGGGNISEDDMKYLLGAMVDPMSTDLSRNKVSSAKVVDDTNEKRMAILVKVYSAENASLLQWSAADDAWYMGSLEGRRFVKGKVVAKRLPHHQDNYEGIVEHLMANPSDLEIISTAPQYKGRLKAEDLLEQIRRDNGMETSKTTPKELSEADKVKAIQRYFNSKEYPYDKRWGLSKLVEKCIDYEVDPERDVYSQE